MKALKEFYDEILQIHGYMVQTEAAIWAWNKFLNDQISSGTSPQQNFYFFEDPDIIPTMPGAQIHYSQSFERLLIASEQNGIIPLMHRRSVIVLIVSSWEDCYRQKISAEIGILKNNLMSDVFHDLNKYRQAILHAGGRLDDNPKSLSFFQKGDEVVLTNEQIYSIFKTLIDDELNRIGQHYYGRFPGFEFGKPLRLPSGTALVDVTDTI